MYNHRAAEFPAGIVGNYTSGPQATVPTGSQPYGIAFDPSGRMYVGDNGGTNVSIYPAGLAGNGAYGGGAIGNIGGGSTGANLPTGIAIDSTGTTYVANYYGNSVTIYPAGITGNYTSAPSATISGGATGLQNPTGIVIF